jgi:glycine dehydrogenase subunit 1
VVREFAVRLDAPVAGVLDRLGEEGIAAGYGLGREYPEYEDGLLIAVTERRSKEDIDRLAGALERAISAIGSGDGLSPDGGKKASRAAEEVAS